MRLTNECARALADSQGMGDRLRNELISALVTGLPASAEVTNDPICMMILRSADSESLSDMLDDLRSRMSQLNAAIGSLEWYIRNR